jgi:hypothetical protein
MWQFAGCSAYGIQKEYLFVHLFTVPGLIITTWRWVLEVVVSHKCQTSETPCSRTSLHGSGGWLVHRAHFGNSLPLSISVSVELPADCQPVFLCISFLHHIRLRPRGPRRESRKSAVVFRTSTVHTQTNESRHLRRRFWKLVPSGFRRWVARYELPVFFFWRN